MRYIILCFITFGLFAKTVTIKIEGMTCPLCTTAIKRSLKKVKGVAKVKVKLNTKSATVTYDNKTTNTKKLLKAIEDTGYKGNL